MILAGKRNITAGTALRLGRYFGMSADFWMNLQSAYELDLARKQSGKAIQRIPRRAGKPLEGRSAADPAKRGPPAFYSLENLSNGRSIKDACLEPPGLTVTEGAKVLGVTRNKLSRVINGQSGISAEMAIRLEKAGWSNADHWLRLQTDGLRTCTSAAAGAPPSGRAV